MMLSDSINIKDAFVVNIGVRYEIITRPSFASRDVLLNCNEALKEYFAVSKRNINQPINLSEISTELDKVQGVQTVQKVEIINKQGATYSEYAYDVKGATRDNLVYPSYDPCFFEIKFPNLDIQGRVINI
jgi:phage-related baseplate assembly protein